MSDLALELKHLEQAEREIIAAERRVSRQALIIQDLRKRGASTQHAEVVLMDCERFLESWHRHRRAVLDAVRQARAGH